MITEKQISDLVVDLVRRSETQTPPDVLAAFQRARSRETVSLAKVHIEAMINNASKAAQMGIPTCAGTGLMIFWVIYGTEVRVDGDFERALIEGVRRSTSEVPVRPEAVHPLTRKNSGDNVGAGIPNIHYKICPGVDWIEITANPKGGGGDAMGSAMKMFRLPEARAGAKQLILDAVVGDGAFQGKACPPFIVGIGLGGTFDQVSNLAREAAHLRRLGTPHPESSVAELETELEEAINASGAGAMGMGGDVTALDVLVEYAHTHTAQFPVAVNIQCGANHRSTARIHIDGTVEYLEHHNWLGGR